MINFEIENQPETMNKIICLLGCLVASFCLEAQSYIGYLTDNYSGVHGVVANPASITDSPFKIDINLAGVSAFANNDYYGIHVFKALKDGYDFDLEAKTYQNAANSAAVDIDILGPSVMFNLDGTSSLAIFSRGRTFFNANDVNGESIASIDNNTTDDFRFDAARTNLLVHAWSEIGITYARTVFNKNEHVLKGGLSLKYLKGYGGAFGSAENVSIDFDADGTNLGGGETTGSLTTTGNLIYARFTEFDNDYEVPNKAGGFGLDLGVVYEWRPQHQDIQADSLSTDHVKRNTDYKLKIGLSFTDIGFVNYKEGVKEAFNINNTNLNEDTLSNLDHPGEILNTLYTRTNQDIGYKVDLPSALHLNVDWNLNSKFYLNLNTDFSLMSRSRVSANRISNMTSLTPRFETKWFSFYMPLSVVENSGFRMGAGLRAGPLYLGSGSVISALTSDNSRQADVYAGLKIPVYKGAARDRDGDGIIDKLDDCPRKAGPISNNGCPILDQDQDGVMDADDGCPEVAGPEENKGCPWGDTDQDGLLDNEDDCPKQAGPEENKGCPWKDTDGDGVLDKDDYCIDAGGTVANNGCPEAVLKELQNTLNGYAKVILFNTGTSAISAESNNALSEIIQVLKAHPSARFVIEGHTDSIGSYEANQRLSESRANSIKNFLVTNGIDAARLSAIGYGERRPIATNMYKAGREQNRRVEINLVR